MIKICVCDDMIKDLEYMEKLVEEFALLHPERPFIFRKFQSPYDLLEFIQTKGCFDVFLLDIIMPNMDGIALGKKIRERKEDCEIIYLSFTREYGVEAFGVEASNYLVKPIKKEDFNHALLRVLDRLSLN